MIEFAKSRPIVIMPYQASWVDEFKELGTALRQAVGDTAVRIDHIGSTSVPDLPAKDIIDIQITVSDLNDPAILEKLTQHGYVLHAGLARDDFMDMALDSLDLQKRYCREAKGQRRTHIHIREDGRFNQQYPLLFRDYLRQHALMCQGYATIKFRLAEIFPKSMDGYLYIKDPLMDMIFVMAQEWANAINWQPDEATL